MSVLPGFSDSVLFALMVVKKIHQNSGFFVVVFLCMVLFTLRAIIVLNINLLQKRDASLSGLRFIDFHTDEIKQFVVSTHL